MSDQVPCEWPRQPQYFGAQPSDRDSGRVGKNKVCDCGGLELAQNPWVALVVVFAQPRGNKAQHCFSQFLFGLVLSVGSLLDLPVFFSALGNSYANWLLVTGPVGTCDKRRAYPIRRSARVLASLCWRNLKVVLWRSPTACEIRWKSGRGQTLPLAFGMCTKQSVGHEPHAVPHCCRRCAHHPEAVRDINQPKTGGHNLVAFQLPLRYVTRAILLYDFQEKMMIQMKASFTEAPMVFRGSPNLSDQNRWF